MKSETPAEKILDVHCERGWSWKQIAGEIGGMSPVLVAGATLGQMEPTKPQREQAASLFGLTESEKRLPNEMPMRGMPMPSTDLLIYCLCELVMVAGPAWKDLIEEESGDGIISAIDFGMEIERVLISRAIASRSACRARSPCQYHGATGNEQALE